MMNTHNPVRIFLLVVAGIIVASYVAAQTSIRNKTTPNKPTSNQSQMAIQIVAQGTTRGAVACARCHGFDGASDGSGAFPRLDGQSAQYLADQVRHFASGHRQNALMQPIAKGLKDDEIEAVSQYYASLHTVPLPSRPAAGQLRTRGEQVGRERGPE